MREALLLAIQLDWNGVLFGVQEIVTKMGARDRTRAVLKVAERGYL